MKIGIVSDTHSLLLPSKLLKDLKGVDLIIHAGDVCDLETLKQFEAIAPVKAVQGNMDDPAVRKRLPLELIIEVEGIKIGVTHGHQGTGRDALSNAKTVFRDQALNAVVFGHSHHAYNEHIGDTLFFNPGSPNDVVKALYFSYGIMDIQKGKLTAKIIKV